MTNECFQKQMLGLAVIYKEPTDDARWRIVLDLYWVKFRDWTNERFIAAVNEHIESSKFFPKPSELIEHRRVQELRERPLPMPVVRKSIVELPGPDNTEENRQAREAAMAEFRKLVESRPMPQADPRETPA